MAAPTAAQVETFTFLLRPVKQNHTSISKLQSLVHFKKKGDIRNSLCKHKNVTLLSDVTISTICLLSARCFYRHPVVLTALEYDGSG